MTSQPLSPPDAGSRRAVAYTDRLFRPFLVLSVIAIVTVELVQTPYPGYALGGWLLLVPTALLSIWTLTPLARGVPTWLQVSLFCLYALLAAALFPLPGTLFSASFTFLVAASAGQLIRSHRLALTVAVLDGVACAVANYVSDFQFPTPWPWWLCVLVGLPVSIGIVRRQRAEGLRIIELAAYEAERASASEAREAALLERGRIAREIHDVLGHSLSAIAIQLDLAQVLRANGRPEEADMASRRARDLARSGIGETRRAVHALHEDQLPVADTLRAVTEDYGALFSSSGESATMSVEKSQALIRATQESLTNAHRHAPGSSTSVELHFAPTGWCSLAIENEAPTTAGRHANVELEGSGMGLESMKNRALELGGLFHCGPTPSGGWRVEVTLPL